MNGDPLGILLRQNNLMRINNGVVEESFCSEDSGNYIVVSYSEPGPGGSSSVQRIRLNLNPNTVILNVNRQRMCLCCIREGSRIDAVFSARMTRSIPPQSNAFLIIVSSNPGAPVSTTTARIASIDRNNNFIYTGNPNDSSKQTRFVMTDTTSVVDQNGRFVGIDALQPGQLVTITHANFQTASIPPQTTAFDVRIL